MSIRHITAVWQTDATIIKGYTRLLLLAFADNSDHNGYSFQSLDYLARKTGISKRHVIRLISELEESTILSVDRSNGAANRYHLDIHKLSTALVDNFSEGVTPCHPRGDTMSPDPYKEKRERENKEKEYLFNPDKTRHWPDSFKDLVIKFLQNTASKGRTWNSTEADFLTDEIEKRGLEQARSDLEFSIRNGYKSYCHAKATPASNGKVKVTSNIGIDALTKLNQQLSNQ